MQDWSSSICDCCCELTCCLALFCPCCVFGQNVKLMQNKWTGDTIPVVDECGCSKCNKPICAGILYALGMVGGFVAGNTTSQYASLLACLSVTMHCRVRRIIRKHNGIDPDCCGDACSDFCCALFCYSCAMAQEQRQLKYVPGQASSSLHTQYVPGEVTAPPSFRNVIIDPRDLLLKPENKSGME